MKLHLSYVAARERSSGRIFFLAETNALHSGAASAQVAHIAELFRAGTPDGTALRSKYSHVLVIVDNHERQSFEFPDPVHAEVETLTLALAEAQRAAVVAGTAADQARGAAAVIKLLDGDRKSAEERAKALQQQLADAQARLAQVPVVAPAPVDNHVAPVVGKPPVELSPSEQLAALSDADLVVVAAEYHVDLKPFQDFDTLVLNRDGLIAALLAAAGSSSSA